MAEAALIEIVGIHPQRVKQPQQHILLGRTDTDLIVADGAAADAQPLRQRIAAHAQLFPPPAQLLSKAHDTTPYHKNLVFLPLFYRVRQDMSRQNHKNLVISFLT